MKQFIDRYVRFRICYYLVIADIILMSPRMLLTKGLYYLPNHPIVIVRHFAYILIQIYLIAGLIKFGWINKLKRFNHYMYYIITFTIMGFIASIVNQLDPIEIKWLKYIPSGIVISMLGIFLLYYFAYKTIKSNETDIFHKLSRFYLYVCLMMPVSVLIILLSSFFIRVFLFIRPPMLIMTVIFIIVGIFLFIYIYIYQFKLFKFLDAKYENKDSAYINKIKEAYKIKMKDSKERNKKGLVKIGIIIGVVILLVIGLNFVF